MTDEEVGESLSQMDNLAMSESVLPLVETTTKNNRTMTEL